MAHPLTRLVLYMSTGAAVTPVMDSYDGQIASEAICIGAVLHLLPLAASLRYLKVTCHFGAAMELLQGMSSRPVWYSTTPCLLTIFIPLEVYMKIQASQDIPPMQAPIHILAWCFASNCLKRFEVNMESNVNLRDIILELTSLWCIVNTCVAAAM